MATSLSQLGRSESLGAFIKIELLQCDNVVFNPMALLGSERGAPKQQQEHAFGMAH